MRIRTATDLGLVIRERRKSLGWGQEALAEKVGVGRQWIVAAEKGKPRAEIALLLRTVEALGLRITADTGKPQGGPKATEIPRIDIDALIEKHRRPKR